MARRICWRSEQTSISLPADSLVRKNPLRTPTSRTYARPTSTTNATINESCWTRDPDTHFPSRIGNYTFDWPTPTTQQQKLSSIQTSHIRNLLTHEISSGRNRHAISGPRTRLGPTLYPNYRNDTHCFWNQTKPTIPRVAKSRDLKQRQSWNRSYKCYRLYNYFMTRCRLSPLDRNYPHSRAPASAPSIST